MPKQTHYLQRLRAIVTSGGAPKRWLRRGATEARSSNPGGTPPPCARCAHGSHPDGTVVAQPQSDNCAIPPLSTSERGDRTKKGIGVMVALEGPIPSRKNAGE